MTIGVRFDGCWQGAYILSNCLCEAIWRWEGHLYYNAILCCALLRGQVFIGKVKQCQAGLFSCSLLICKELIRSQSTLMAVSEEPRKRNESWFRGNLQHWMAKVGHYRVGGLQCDRIVYEGQTKSRGKKVSASEKPYRISPLTLKYWWRAFQELQIC